MHPRPELRPGVDRLLAVPQIKKILRRRRLMKPFIKIVSQFIDLSCERCKSISLIEFSCLFLSLQKKFTRSILNRCYMMRLYVVNLFVSMLSIFKLRHLKRANPPHNIALTSTPTAPTIAILQTSDDSFLRLDDSEIDFEDSPSNRSCNRSMGKLPDSLIVNSTPLNHYSSQGAFRRSRMEISRTSLV